jgi:predicted ATP-grasp superfamily ATP-dependent carboligase
VDEIQGGQAVKTSTETLIAAMHILATEIQSDDGAANAAVAEAGERLAEQYMRITQLEQENDALKQRIKRLEETLENVTDKLDGAWGIYMQFKEPKP